MGGLNLLARQSLPFETNLLRYRGHHGAKITERIPHRKQ